MLESPQQILQKIEAMLMKLGLKVEFINDTINYTYDNVYCRPCYIRSLGFLIEYAHSKRKAELNVYGDGDCYRLDEGVNVIVSALEWEVRKGVLNENVPHLEVWLEEHVPGYIAQYDD